ncbi:pyridoxamine 5'-phosphate oxidase family protein [Paenibacillus sp. HN-1]|uniref:pyridoxamine 5'-phosphate oxidase family protein n=1 Tax=Paenibacillus TaxID=44249 RepID=UPI001CA96C36|nr:MULTISPECIES: pyridoxamine 5'-phosphate oxidase family protein [Paenibacillus]MBY9080278.1 pyridoxamine 5'-phosphate oxidase family protein [Paenibacillus sp. CGMCC 1.18879]MBY9083063.1 pyridoxamine 5'-phosphate oxidase family protein [Paenibacillus sinensis]
MSEIRSGIVDYLEGTRFVVLATVNGEGTPELRTLGGFAVDGYKVYFSTDGGTEKVKQIRSNPAVTLLFQHENQELAGFVNVTLRGEARQVEEPEELAHAIEALGNRNPRFKERAEKGELASTAIFGIAASEIKVLDFAKGRGAEAVEVIAV